MHLQVSTEPVGDATVVRAVGELDLHTAPALQTESAGRRTRHHASDAHMVGPRRDGQRTLGHQPTASSTVANRPTC